ncbi:dihydroneopterin aldolase [uncultured Shimia sp.]|uniref:dihydroneopterin aldolase n=1 Tax=uncultured Shimia sp. TaxID=573152 RepID=UPI00261300E9|nr:dihydroneopterin aldolase [uncultured Shimia sp.]
MTDETRLAFAHPSERSAATAGSDPLDRISVRDLTVEVEIGAFQVERDTTQRVRFNVVVEVRAIETPVEDDVDRILSYDKVTEAIHGELSAERLNLLETLAERIGDRILSEPQAVRVFVRIEKLDRGAGVLGVEIVRSAKGLAKSEADSPHPRIVFLSNEALESDNLRGWVDQLCDSKDPLVICVGPHALPVPQANGKAAQTRIDLLSIEQNALSLSAREPRCEVVATRTELDWAMRNGHPCIWAPSKIVLDAVDGPDAPPSDSLMLAFWFANLLDASSVLSIGETLPRSTTLPAAFHPVQDARI